MLYLNCLAWKARLRIEFRFFMVRNFTTMVGAVAEVDEAIAENASSQRFSVDGDELSRL